MTASTDDLRGMLQSQLETSWKLLDFHLTDLSDEECLWLPAGRGLQVVNVAGSWIAEWPETEAYTIGPASIGWLTWHIGFWWSMALDHSFGDGGLRREDVTWPGAAEPARAWLTKLHDEWEIAFSSLSQAELVSADRTRWPFSGEPFYRLAGWLNLELMKNAAEIGYCRFYYAAR